MNFILAAIPLFLLLIIIELAVDRYRGTGYYRFNDAINSLNLGIFSRVTGILKAAIPFSVYYLLYENYALFTFNQDNIWFWLTAFVLYDLAYYWIHRLNHRVSVMWGSHVVHHSSEEYNLTTALRQTSTPSLLGWVIVLPLAYVGISPVLLLACASLNLIYQFWVHTRHVDKMPTWFEAIFVTPSHHRVHHALNRDYIDKNFGGVLILWDKLFNSFQAEKSEINTVYGVSQQLKSWNPLWANFQVYLLLWQDAWRTRNWRDKIKVWFMPPGWRPDDVKQDYPRKYVTTKTMHKLKYDVDISHARKQYLACQYLVFLLGIVGLLLGAGQNSLLTNLTLCVAATINLVIIGWIQAGRPYALFAECIRLFLSSAAVVWQLPEAYRHMAMISALVYIVVSISFIKLYVKVREDNILSNKDTVITQ
ncbi:sterol desaturase family protein [Thalassotalea fusca]